MSPIEKAILKTLTWFSSFKRPLTKEEIWQYLYTDQQTDFDIHMFEQAVRSLIDQKKIYFEEGYYALTTDLNLIKEYQVLAPLREQKWKRALKYIHFLSHLPFVRAVAICNNLAFGVAHEKSDIDLLIITTRNRIWSARFWVTAWAEVWGWRKTTHDPVCLSFFVDEETLDITQYALGNDTYYKYWLSSLKFVYDPKDIKNNFWNANKKHVQTQLPHIQPSYTPAIGGIRTKGGWYIPKLGYQAFSESFLEKLQRHFLINQKIRDAEDGSRVVLKNSVIKLHTTDRREEYNHRFNENIRKI